MNFSAKQLKALRTEFSKLPDKVDPTTPQYKRMVLLLDFMNLTQLKAIEKADIKFLSVLARNRIVRKENKPPVVISSLESLMGNTVDAEDREVAENVAPSAVLLASTVEKVRTGNSVTTYELAPLINRLAFANLSSDEIADRFTKAFEDVLLPQE